MTSEGVVHQRWNLKITSRREAFNPISLFTFSTKLKLPTAIASDQQRLVQTVPAVQSLRSVQIFQQKNSGILECECLDTASAMRLLKIGEASKST
jgi:hypothetical protein